MLVLIVIMLNCSFSKQIYTYTNIHLLTLIIFFDGLSVLHSTVLYNNKYYLLSLESLDLLLVCKIQLKPSWSEHKESS